MTQRPFDPRAGFVAALDGEPYPFFPAKGFDRARWAMEAPIGNVPAQSLLNILAIRANENGCIYVSADKLAWWGSMGRRTVFDALDRLGDAGWLWREPQRRPLSTHYWPKSPAEKRCEVCHVQLPKDLLDQPCPSCGIILGVREPHLMVREPHPLSLGSTK